MHKNVRKQIFPGVISEKEYRAIFPAMTERKWAVGAVRQRFALATPSSPWSVARWITNRWSHLWGKSTQSGQLLPVGDKQSSARASPDESFWDVITRVGDWWNYPVQHQTQSGCKSAEAEAEREQLILYALPTVLKPWGCMEHLNNIIKWPCKEI